METHASRLPQDQKFSVKKSNVEGRKALKGKLSSRKQNPKNGEDLGVCKKPIPRQKKKAVKNLDSDLVPDIETCLIPIEYIDVPLPDFLLDKGPYAGSNFVFEDKVGQRSRSVSVDDMLELYESEWKAMSLEDMLEQFESESKGMSMSMFDDKVDERSPSPSFSIPPVTLSHQSLPHSPSFTPSP